MGDCDDQLCTMYRVYHAHGDCRMRYYHVRDHRIMETLCLSWYDRAFARCARARCVLNTVTKLLCVPTHCKWRSMRKKIARLLSPGTSAAPQSTPNPLSSNHQPVFTTHSASVPSSSAFNPALSPSAHGGVTLWTAMLISKIGFSLRVMITPVLPEGTQPSAEHTQTDHGRIRDTFTRRKSAQDAAAYAGNCTGRSC